MTKHWIRILPLACLTALLCATLAAADIKPTPLNCHEMSRLLLGLRDEAQLLGVGETPEEAALSDYFAAREAAYRGDTRLLSGDDDWNTSVSVAGNNDLRAARVREMETRLGLTVLDADVTVQIDREHTTPNPDGTLTLYAYEWTFYDYDDLADGPGGLDVAGFGTWHILTVAPRPDGSRQILSDEYDEEDLFGISTLSEARLLEVMGDSAAEPDAPVSADETASLQAFSYFPEYDPEKVYAYAEQYWGGEGTDNYNSAYANFNGKGGDCANFASQCIAAGGMPQAVTRAYANNGWYYNTDKDYSATWNNSTNLHKWMSENRGHLATASRDTVFAGSPVFYSTRGDGTFQHTAICIGTNSAGTPIIAAHNNNRWGKMWNYYTTAVQIDTVQLTSKSFGSLGGYVKLDADFFAYIANPSQNLYLTNDGGGRVMARTRTEQSGQVWHFLRQSDGSYELASVLRGETVENPALAVQNSGWASQTPVCVESYDASPGQQWYIYWTRGNFSWGQSAYQFRPQCSDSVLDSSEAVIDIDAQETDTGADLRVSTRSGENAQLFQIYETQWITIDKPVLQVVLEGGEGANVRFSWESLAGAASYTLRVTQEDNAAFTPVSVTLRNTTSHALKLAPGTYQATLEAVSADGRASNISDAVPFPVYTSYAITYDANGGEEAPEEQIKIERQDIYLTENVPTRPGYVFTDWNAAANGTGASYQSGTVYDKDEDITLYAQWELAQYTVTLDPNHNTPDRETMTVTYDRPYGELPTPTLDQYEFSGWYTEPDGGERITDESIVTSTEDHTLYAHWESTVASISSRVTRDGDYYLVHTVGYRITGGVLFACAYANGQLTDIASIDATDSNDLVLEGDCDTVRVFALDAATHRPLCGSNTIYRQQFR